MWCGSVTFRVKGKDVPRDVTRVRSRITQDEVKSGVNLRTQEGSYDDEGGIITSYPILDVKKDQRQ